MRRSDMETFNLLVAVTGMYLFESKREGWSGILTPTAMWCTSMKVFN